MCCVQTQDTFTQKRYFCDVCHVILVGECACQQYILVVNSFKTWAVQPNIYSLLHPQGKQANILTEQAVSNEAQVKHIHCILYSVYYTQCL